MWISEQPDDRFPAITYTGNLSAKRLLHEVISTGHTQGGHLVLSIMPEIQMILTESGSRRYGLAGKPPGH